MLTSSETVNDLMHQRGTVQYITISAGSQSSHFMSDACCSSVLHSLTLYPLPSFQICQWFALLVSRYFCSITTHVRVRSPHAFFLPCPPFSESIRISRAMLAFQRKLAKAFQDNTKTTDMLRCLVMTSTVPVLFSELDMLYHSPNLYVQCKSSLMK